MDCLIAELKKQGQRSPPVSAARQHLCTYRDARNYETNPFGRGKQGLRRPTRSAWIAGDRERRVHHIARGMEEFQP